MSTNEDSKEAGLPAPRSFATGDVVISCEPWVWSFQYHYYKTLCAWCFTDSVDLKTCSNCNLYRYCDTRCQAASWRKEHKHECEMLKTVNSRLTVYSGRNDHECGRSIYTCNSQFGCVAAEILVAKVAHKIMGKGREKQPGCDGKLSAMDILAMLPEDPTRQELHNVVNLEVSAMVFPLPTLLGIPDFCDITRKVCYNAFPIMEQRGKIRLMGWGIFPQAAYRLMTPVCWDINVTMDFQGRMLVVRATEDIPKYSGLKDLRQNERQFRNFYVTREDRRKGFEKLYGRFCDCRGCTKEYDAEISPLKCSTIGCTARIPSDRRALNPCPQCGATNGDRLLKFKALTAEFVSMEEQVRSRSNLPIPYRRYQSVFEEVGTVAHADAHFRFVCGFTVTDSLQKIGLYEEAWNLCLGMVDCARAIYPTYHLGRARLLTKSGAIGCTWARLCSGQHEELRVPVIGEVLLIALKWLKEAHDIYKKLGGEDSKWAKVVAKLIADNTALRSFAEDWNRSTASPNAQWDLANHESVALW